MAGMTSAAAADLASLAADLAVASGDGMMIAAQKVIQDAAQRIQAEAQTRAPIKSGRLKESITIRYPSPLSAVIGPQAPYGVYQEFGTGERGEFPGSAYEIRPKRPGGSLVFKVGNKTVFAKKVRHPGVRPKPYMRPAFEAALGTEIVTRLAELGAAMITKGTKG